MVEVLFSFFAVPQEPFQIVVCAETLLILDMVCLMFNFFEIISMLYDFLKKYII